MANKGAVLNGLKERFSLGAIAGVISRMIIDSSNRLQVTLAGSNTLTTVTTVTTVSTLTGITNWGATSANGYIQLLSAQAYQQGFRRNLS